MKNKKESILTVTWENLPFWLQWGTIGGVFSLLLIIVVYIGMSFNYLAITRNLVKEGLIASFIALSAGFAHAVLFSILIHGAGFHKEKKKRGRMSFSKKEIKESSKELSIGLSSTGVAPTR